jgi:isoleucyl-tRNA synthetase
VPIPSLHSKITGESILTSDSLSYIIDVLDRKGTAHWWEGPVEDFVSISLAAQHPPNMLMKGTDTMDVWFDSGTSWSLIPSQGIRSKHDTLSDVCLEGSDQHRGWFQSLLLTYIGASDGGAPPRAPYSTVITHGFTLDEKGNKMSKSLGNVISPIAIINGGNVRNPIIILVSSSDRKRLELEGGSGLWSRRAAAMGCQRRVWKRCFDEQDFARTICRGPS